MEERFKEPKVSKSLKHKGRKGHEGLKNRTFVYFVSFAVKRPL
jgi:hypothetical protein